MICSTFGSPASPLAQLCTHTSAVDLRDAVQGTLSAVHVLWHERSEKDLSQEWLRDILPPHFSQVQLGPSASVYKKGPAVAREPIEQALDL
jgi:hypothetical protein